MFRRLMGILAAISIVLAVGVTTMWVRVLPPPPPPIPLPLSVRIFNPLAPKVDLAKWVGPLPSFRGCQLRDVLDWLSGLGGGQVEADWPAIKSAGLDPLTPVPRDAATFGTLGSTLADVLAPMGLSFVSDNYVTHVSTVAGVERLGHLRHIDRITLTTRTDTIASAALDDDTALAVSAPSSSYSSPPTAAPPQFDPDWPALRAAGIDERFPADWGNYSHAQEWLEWTLRGQSAAQPLRYAIRDGRVVISTAAAFEAAERNRLRMIAFAAFGLFVAFCIAMIAARRRAGARRLLCLGLVVLTASAVCVTVWRARPDTISARIGRSRWTFSARAAGDFELSRSPATPEEVFLTHHSNGPARAVYVESHGFYAAREGPPFQNFDAHAPRWAVVALLAAAPLIWSARNLPIVATLPRRIRQRRRARTGLCVQCGYDLRGSVGRCPECGSPPCQTEPFDEEGKEVKAKDVASINA